VRKWVPELRQVPVDVWHGRVEGSPQLALDLYAGAEYPEPAVDHAVAARAFLRRYRAFASS
jgi:deoxyribodipyrimidine photolyase